MKALLLAVLCLTMSLRPAPARSAEEESLAERLRSSGSKISELVNFLEASESDDHERLSRESAECAELIRKALKLLESKVGLGRSAPYDCFRDQTQARQNDSQQIGSTKFNLEIALISAAKNAAILIKLKDEGAWNVSAEAEVRKRLDRDLQRLADARLAKDKRAAKDASLRALNEMTYAPSVP